MGKEQEIDTGAEQMRFKKKLKEFEKYSGRGTELISVYIPPNADRSSVMGQLTEEISQSSNIKSAITRKNVQGALRKIINYLKVIDFKIPMHGIVVFCGNISEVEGRTDVRLFTLIPIKELKTKLYWCDNKFHLVPLKEMQAPTEVYGLIVMDKREATIAKLEGKHYNIVSKLTSAVPGKIKAGGQSSVRFAALREEAEHDFYKRLSDRVNTIFMPIGTKLKGLIIGGPGATKNYWLNAELLHDNLQKKIIGLLDTGYTDESGIREIVQKSGEILKDSDLNREREIVDKFIEQAVKNGLAMYGFKEVIEALDKGQVDTLMISEGLEWLVIKFVCSQNHITEKIIKDTLNYDLEKEKCPVDGQNVELLEQIDYQDFLIEKAQANKTKVRIISTETQEGTQFFQGFGGIGALLRYKL